MEASDYRSLEPLVQIRRASPDFSTGGWAGFNPAVQDPVAYTPVPHTAQHAAASCAGCGSEKESDFDRDEAPPSSDVNVVSIRGKQKRRR